MTARNPDPMIDTMENSNRSSNPTIHDVSDPGRRIVLRGALGATLAAFYTPFLGGSARAGREGAAAAAPSIGFKGIAVDPSDRVVVPDGYVARPIAAWGEPV